MAKRQQLQQQPRMEMVATATIRDNPRSLLEDLLEDRPEVDHDHHHQRVLSELSPAPHLLLRKHCHPSGARDFLEDLGLPPDQNSTSSTPPESQRERRKQ